VLTGDSAGVWWVTCFAVASHYRRSGVGLALPSALYTGTKTMFAAAGFAELARTYPTRPVMRFTI
jgi:hypothetical protein